MPATITPITIIAPTIITPITIITRPVVKDITIKNDTKQHNRTKTLKSALKQPNGTKRPARKNIVEAIPEHLNTESYKMYRNNRLRQQIKFSDHLQWIVFDPTKGIANNKEVQVRNEVIAYLDQERRKGWFQQQKKIWAEQAKTSTTTANTTQPTCPTAPPDTITIATLHPRFRSHNNDIIIATKHIPTIPQPPPLEICPTAPRATVSPPPVLTTVPS
jgi:hypothetical protein